MSSESKNYVTWTALGIIVTISIFALGMFANMTNEKLNGLIKKTDDIDKRTAFLEGLNEGQKTSFKQEVSSILDKLTGQ